MRLRETAINPCPSLGAEEADGGEFGIVVSSGPTGLRASIPVNRLKRLRFVVRQSPRYRGLAQIVEQLHTAGVSAAWGLPTLITAERHSGPPWDSRAVSCASNEEATWISDHAIQLKE